MIERRRPRIYPAYEVRETDGAIRLQIELPGLERENVSITVENNQLVVSGSRPDWSVDGTVLVRERRVGDYYRAFTLDNTVDADAIEATMRNGVLDLTIPLTESAKPRRIEITGS
jgi:HSP20 family protein